MRQYLCMYRGKKVTIDATSKFDAQVRAAEMLKVRHIWEIIVELTDTPISTASL